jgi:hypothetical protein
MNSPPAATSATDRTEVRRRDWAGEPGLMLGDRGYDELLAQVRRALTSRDVMEEMWIRDVVDLAWDIFRLRRMKANLMRSAPGTHPGGDLSAGPRLVEVG